MSVQATFSATLVDEWVLLGVTDAVICAGSRSTPLALPLAERLRIHVRLDERSAGFFALGLAMATGRPPIICVTSGTAAAELHPAVVEAHHAGVPLIVCTADRPPELHHTGAPQSIEQNGLFGAATRWSFAPGVAAQGQEETWRPLAVRAFEEAVHGIHGPGPVHLNLEFREPLTGVSAPLPARHGPKVISRRRDGTDGAGGTTVEPLGGRGMIIAGGPWSQRADAARVGALADKLGWPVLADPLSGSRLEGAIAAADAIVRTEPPVPECIVLLGAPWLSRALGTFVSDASAAGARIVVVDPLRRWADPLRVATEFHHCEVDQWLDAANATATPSDPDWLDSWHERETKAQNAIAEVLGADLSEPLVARVVHRYAAETAATLLVAASMPIRDLEWYAEATPRPPRVLANRGANGIDGVVSTALGVAASGGGSGQGARTVALLGDLTFLHDVSGLVNLPESDCTFVVLDNGGGGIFSFLPQATSVESGMFEQLFGTPPTSDIGAVARGFGLSVHDVADLSQLESALAAPTPALVRVKVPDRAQNVALHDAINQAVRLALQ